LSTMVLVDIIKVDANGKSQPRAVL
jgi:hypothetical protein